MAAGGGVILKRRGMGANALGTRKYGPAGT
jgi:hypothetical protein